MPHLNVQLGGTTRDNDGNDVDLPGSAALKLRGPVVEVSITVSEEISKELQQQGHPVPDPVSGHGLVDTGATSTCIDNSVADQLGLPATDVVRLASASHESNEHYVYPCSFWISGLPVSVNAPRVTGAPLQSQGIIALIGRDLLEHFVVIYNGPAGQITLSL